MEITNSNISNMSYDFLKSKLDYSIDLSSYTERLIKNELKNRQAEMEKYLYTGLYNLTIEELKSLKSNSQRYPVDFVNKVTDAIINRIDSKQYKSNNYNNRWVAPIIIVLIGIVAVFTNPDSEKHKEAIKLKCYSIMQNSISEVTRESPNSGKLVGRALGMIIGNPLIDVFVETTVSSDSYIIFSTTKITLDGNTAIIGIGAFGNIFLDSRIDEVLEDELYENKKLEYKYK